MQHPHSASGLAQPGPGDPLAMLDEMASALRDRPRDPRLGAEAALSILGRTLDLTRVELRVQVGRSQAQLVACGYPNVAKGGTAPAADDPAHGRGVPVHSRGQRVGQLYVERSEGTIGSRDRMLMGVVADLLSEPARTLASYHGALVEGSLRSMMDAFEREILTEAMRAAGGIQSRAARALKTTPRILSYRLRRQGLHDRLTGR